VAKLLTIHYTTVQQRKSFYTKQKALFKSSYSNYKTSNIYNKEKQKHKERQKHTIGTKYLQKIQKTSMKNK